MQKVDTLSLSDSSLHLKIPQSIKNQPHLDSSFISCPECHIRSLSSLIIHKKHDSYNYNIKIVCNKNHTVEMPLSKFNNIYYPSYTKECSKCKKQTVIIKINYCSLCKLFLCKNCLNEHKKDSCNISNYYSLLENLCNEHEQKIKEYYCVECQKFFCKLCLQKHDQNHKNIINLNEKFLRYEKVIKAEILKEKSLLEKYNRIINSLREDISNKIKQKKMRLQLKKSILNSYRNNQMNYYNIQNMDLAKNHLIFDFDDKKLKNLVEQFKKY